MTAPVNSFQTNFGRFYSHPKFVGTHSTDADGVLIPGRQDDSPYKPNPSITNIIGMMNKDFLPRYYAKLVAEYAVDNLESLQFARDRFGRDMAVGTAKAVVNQPHPNAAIGDEVHDAIDRWVKGEAPKDLVNQFSTSTADNMFRQFLHFMHVKQDEIEIVRSEYTVWSYRHGYAGTGDLLWYDRGRLCIVDTKTGANVHPEVAMQTVAISKADVILEPDGSELEIGDMFADVDLYVLHVRPRSVKLHKLFETEEAWKTFLACRQIFDWHVQESLSVIEPEPFKTQFKKGDANG